MTIAPDVTAFLADEPREADPLIRNGRYQIVPANGDKPKAHTRITNFAKKLEDEYGLTKWKMRTVLLGAARRPDIVLAALANDDDKQKLDQLAEDATDAANANVKRESGTALHRLAERVDQGETLKLPEPTKSDIAAYSKCLVDLKAEVELIEAVVVCPRLNVAGRLDRTVIIDGVRFILDLKTGEDLSYSWGSIAIQLALYAGAETIYDPDKKKHHPMPDVDQSRAIVIHLPAGKGTATAYWVNLEGGRRGIALVKELLEYRKGTKFLATLEPGQFVARPELREYVAARVGYVIDSGHGAELAATWPNVPTLKASDQHTELQLDSILAQCLFIEADHHLPFPDFSDPRGLGKF